MTPEERARQQIDLLLQQSGWIVQNRFEINLSADPGVAIREARLKAGEADYLLFAHGKALATVEAKPEGYTLTEELFLSLRDKQSFLSIGDDGSGTELQRKPQNTCG